jgi:chemotaxis signal transduction protein
LTLKDPDFTGRTAALREAFDRTFTLAHAGEPPPHFDLLQIEVGGQSYALRLADVVELVADRTLVPVPSPRPDLLGLVGLRGVVTPVYDLALALGHEPAPRPRWLARLRAPAPFAVAFEHFERHCRVPASALAAAREPGRGAFVRASVRVDEHPLPVIDLPAIFESVARRGATPERAEERR